MEDLTSYYHCQVFDMVRYLIPRFDRRWWIVNGGSHKLLSWSLARGWLHPTVSETIDQLLGNRQHREHTFYSLYIRLTRLWENGQIACLFDKCVDEWEIEQETPMSSKSCPQSRMSLMSHSPIEGCFPPNIKTWRKKTCTGKFFTVTSFKSLI